MKHEFKRGVSTIKVELGEIDGELAVFKHLNVTSYVGKSLNLKYPPAERKKFKPRIQMMNRELINSYGIHHNDIRWKNVVESDNGDLFLIDFECWTPTSVGSRERDPEKILS